MDREDRQRGDAAQAVERGLTVSSLFHEA